MYRKFFKRFLDIVGASLALLLLAPFMLVVAALIWLEDHGPVIFRQDRIGQNGKTFRLLKFRSMPENIGDVESAKARALPVTRTGKFMRRTNIDELPQLFNVLKGEMSLVGPRPPIPSQKELCSLRVLNGSMDCVPGLTGLAQINGYDGMPDDEKAKWDAEYRAKLSFYLDTLVVLKTFAYLKRRPPAY